MRSLPSAVCDFRRALPWTTYAAIKPKAWYTLGQHSADWVTSIFCHTKRFQSCLAVQLHDVACCLLKQQKRDSWLTARHGEENWFFSRLSANSRGFSPIPFLHTGGRGTQRSRFFLLKLMSVLPRPLCTPGSPLFSPPLGVQPHTLNPRERICSRYSTFILLHIKEEIKANISTQSTV